MKKDLFSNNSVIGEPMNRVDGKLKVTGGAKYAAEYDLPNLVHAVLVTSTIAKGSIRSIDSKQAERAPGVTAVVSHLNTPPVPGYADNGRPAQFRPLRVFYNNQVYFYGQPVAIVVADTLERARHAASLVKVQYQQEQHQTDFNENKSKADLPSQAKNNPQSGNADYVRGEADYYKKAPVHIEAEYIIPIEVHNPMEMHAVVAHWEAPDKLTVYDKTQGVKDTQRSLMQAFNLPEQNVQVNSQFVGGAFGSALRTWPHVIAAVLAAKKVNKPVKLILGRDQMFNLVGYRPYTWQKIGIGATQDGKLLGITHEATGQTSSYEEFTEGSVRLTRMMYACPNVTTRYRILHLDVSTPTWMRGPGEATGAYALESAMDELAYALNMDPLEFRLRNYAESDPERNRPWSSKFLKECYQQGAERIGWSKRSMQPGVTREGDMLVGYGMAGGVFGAHRGGARAKARLLANGSLIIQSAASDIGPGTGTAMVQIAADTLGIDPAKISFQLGNSSLPQAPSQGGSATVSTVGSAVQMACASLKQKLQELSGNPNISAEAYTQVLQQHNLPEVEVMAEAKPGEEQRKYSMYSFSVHFVQVHVHPATGQVRVNKVVTCADSGTIINKKTAGSQMIGGVIGGIGMALMEEAVMDHRYGRIINNNFADYHVPVNADIPHIDVVFMDKPDPYINPMGSKGMGEIALIGCAAAVANAVFNATGKRIRELPVTPDKLIV